MPLYQSYVCHMNHAGEFMSRILEFCCPFTHTRTHQGARIEAEHAPPPPKKPTDINSYTRWDTRVPWCHPRLSPTLLPRTHVWCSGRVSAPLFGIPSSGPPQFPRSPALSIRTSLPRISLPPFFPLPLSPSFTLFAVLKFLTCSQERLTLQTMLRSSRTKPATGWDFTRTATPNGALGGSAGPAGFIEEDVVIPHLLTPY